MTRQSGRRHHIQQKRIDTTNEEIFFSTCRERRRNDSSFSCSQRNQTETERSKGRKQKEKEKKNKSCLFMNSYRRSSRLPLKNVPDTVFQNGIEIFLFLEKKEFYIYMYFLRFLFILEENAECQFIKKTSDGRYIYIQF